MDEKQAMTIHDFGEQWHRFPRTHDAIDLFQDHFGEIFQVSDLKDRDVVDIGSGTGRVIQWIADVGAKKIYAIEPSSSMEILKANTADIADIVEYRQVSGEDMKLVEEVDYVISLGVIHHIPYPEKTMQSAYTALRSGGRCAIWVYGMEGQRSFVYAMTVLRWFVRKSPNWLLHMMCYAIAVASYAFTFASRKLNFPLSGYFKHIFSNWSFKRRVVCIFDQLKPAYAKYYSENEARALLAKAGFSNVSAYHRHGYSWCVIGTKQ